MKPYLLNRSNIMLILFLSFFSDCDVDKTRCFNCKRETNNGFQWIYETKYICGTDSEIEYEMKVYGWRCDGYEPLHPDYDLCFECKKSGYQDKRPCGDEDLTRTLAEGYECSGTPVDTLWYNK
jgi:hypothetical protein